MATDSQSAQSAELTLEGLHIPVASFGVAVETNENAHSDLFIDGSHIVFRGW
jgi:hypothetical protein